MPPYRRRVLPCAVLVTLLGFLPGAVSLAAAQAPAEAAPFKLSDLGLKGYAVYKNFSHFRETPFDNRNFRNEGVLQLEWDRKLAEWARLKLVGEAREDDDRFAKGLSFQIPETTTHRSIVSLTEAVLTLKAGPVELTLGKQFFAWGTADFYNPTSINLNPYDYLDPIDNEKMGVYSAATRLTRGPTSLVFVVVPVLTPSRQPFGSSRWTPVSDTPVIVDGRELPDRSIDNMEYAARLRTTVAGWDVSGSYFDGYEKTPVLRRDPTSEIPRFAPVFTRIKAPGADLSTTFGKLEVHAEASAKFVESEGNDDAFQGIGGVNYTWDELGVTWLEEISLILEYARETILNSTPPSLIVEPVGLRAFRESLVGRVQLKFSEETQLKLATTLDVAGPPSHFVQLKLAHKLSDAFHAEAGLEFFAGGRDTFYGRWKDNDRFTFMAKYYF